MRFRKPFSFRLFSVVVLLLQLGSACSEQPHFCNCDHSALAFNDSLLSDPQTSASLSGFAERYRQSPLRSLDAESYRLTMGHSFGQRYHQVYTLSKTANGCDLEVQEFRSSEWRVPTRRSKWRSRDQRVRAYTVRLNREDWSDFEKVKGAACFWAMRMLDSTERYGILDGGSMYLEGYQPGGGNCFGWDYLIVYRHYTHPKNKSAFNTMVNWLKEHAREERLHVYSDEKR